MRDDGRGKPEGAVVGSGIRVVRSLARQLGSELEEISDGGLGFALGLRIDPPPALPPSYLAPYFS